MIRTLRWLVPVVFCVCVLSYVSFVSSQDGKKYSIKTDVNPLPKDLSEAVQKLLDEKSIQFVDAGGKPICDVWFRKDIPAEATPEQIKTGVTFREVKQTEVLGAIQFHRDWSDYRKQKIKPGVYTMRLAYQPTDGKHTADVSEFQDFVLMIKAAADTKPVLMDAKSLHDRSGDSLDLAHPAVFMLWPNNTPGKQPDLAARPKDHWVLNSKAGVLVDGKVKGSMGIGLTLVGHSPVD